MAGRLRPTDWEVRCLIAYAKTGDVGLAAAELGIEGNTMRNNLYSLRKKLGVRTSIQAYYLLVQGVKLSQTIRLEAE